MGARLLFVGDIHLGRRPSRLPADLERFGLRTEDFTPAAAWRSCVDHVIAAGLDAVVLAGDVVDGLDDRFEAYGHLQAGISRLIEAEIPIFAVAGNHDVQALPRLAGQLPAFRLLGAGGDWESLTIATAAGVPVRLLGWSFPAAHVRRSPLESLRFVPQAGIATLAVLHCDLAAGASPYAPVSRRDLERVPVDAWLLGHVHRPSSLEGDTPVGYLGSLVGLDPGEPGRHGPWLLEVEGPGRVRARQIPLAPLRFERVDWELGEFDEVESGDPADLLFEALRAAMACVHRRIVDDATAFASEAGPRLVGCRIRLSGRGRHHPAVRRQLGAPQTYPRETWDGAHYFVEKVEERAAPDLDLAAIARGDDPPALLAGRLLLLLQGGDGADTLLRRAARVLQDGTSAARWQRLERDVASDQALRELLLCAGTRQLEALLAQGPRPTSAAPRSDTGEDRS